MARARNRALLHLFQTTLPWAPPENWSIWNVGLIGENDPEEENRKRKSYSGEEMIRFLKQHESGMAAKDVIRHPRATPAMPAKLGTVNESQNTPAQVNAVAIPLISEGAVG